MVLGNAGGGIAMIWDAVRYGFSPLYWMTVEGIPVVWIEKATAKTLPSGFVTEAAVLSIDKSGAIGIEQIDRMSGNPSTPPLSFSLLDSAVTRDWMRKPSATTVLTAAATAAAGALTVASSTGFSTECFVGMERMTISGTGPTTLTLSARGVNGWAYAHPLGTGSQLVTDRPRFWRGRQVRLYAAPMDAAGYVTGATLASDSIEVWRGRISTAPVRTQDGFALDAEALERILDGKLPSVVSGTVAQLGGYFAAKLGATVKFNVDIRDGSNIILAQYMFSLKPFNGTSYSQNQLLTGATLRKLLVDSYAAAITTLAGGADLKGLQFTTDGNGMYQAQVGLGTFATAAYVKVEATVFNGVTTKTFIGTGNKLANAFNIVDMPWLFRDSPWAFSDIDAPGTVNSIAIKLDDSKSTTVPVSGTVYIGSADASFAYQYGAFVDGRAVLVLKFPAEAAEFAGMLNANATIKNIVAGQYYDEILTVLQSSGTAALRGTYDTLARGAGYSLDSTMMSATSLQVGPMYSSQTPQIIEDGQSFWDLFGGILGLYRFALVQKYNSFAGRVQLTLVPTSAPFAPDGATITDAELLAHKGDPITAVRRVEAPNSITLTMTDAAQNNDYIVVFNDVPNIEAQGLRSAELTIPADNREKLRDEATYLAASSFAYDQSAQAAELLVPPWIRADVGDTVILSNLTHPSLWTWTTSPGQVGYNGLGRVIGRTLNLSSLEVKLVVLFDGGTIARGLSPSAEVSAFTGAAGAVTSLTVPLVYYYHLAATRASAGGNYYVQHYRPGQIETTTQYHLVTAEAIVGGACVLTIGSHVGGHTVVVNSSRLTLPTLTGGRLVAYQGYFAHVGDGANWA